MPTRSKERRTVKTAEKTFEMFELLMEMDGARVTELADRIDMAKSTVHRYLATFERSGFVVKEGDEYNIGLRMAEFGEYATSRKKVYQLAEQAVEALAEETEERVVFVVEEHGMGVYVHVATGPHAVAEDPGPGKRIPLHATASGKAILAFLPEPHIDAIIDQRPLDSRTDNTITDREALAEELESVREQGYALNLEENMTGVRSIAVPIKPHGRVVGALTVSTPTQRMKVEEFEQNILNSLLGVANELELKITGTDWTVH